MAADFDEPLDDFKDYMFWWITYWIPMLWFGF
jgi:hypothetical protein